MFVDYVAKNSLNVRAGTVIIAHDGTSVEFTDVSTQDLGDTSSVVFTADLSGGDIRLLATVDTDNWEIKTFVKGL